eukprot:5982491-Amphidinium_carterae.4
MSDSMASQVKSRIAAQPHQPSITTTSRTESSSISTIAVDGSNFDNDHPHRDSGVLHNQRVTVSALMVPHQQPAVQAEREVASQLNLPRFSLTGVRPHRAQHCQSQRVRLKYNASKHHICWSGEAPKLHRVKNLRGKILNIFWLLVNWRGLKKRVQAWFKTVADGTLCGGTLPQECNEWTCRHLA